MLNAESYSWRCLAGQYRDVNECLNHDTESDVVCAIAGLRGFAVVLTFSRDDRIRIIADKGHGLDAVRGPYYSPSLHLTRF